MQCVQEHGSLMETVLGIADFHAIHNVPRVVLPVARLWTPSVRYMDRPRVPMNVTLMSFAKVRLAIINRRYRRGIAPPLAVM